MDSAYDTEAIYKEITNKKERIRLKIYISADIEGVAGITAWDEARRSSPTYPYFADQMTKEVAAACEGAAIAGARHIVVKDAHGSGMNINPSKLPEDVQLIRGWSGHPYKMLQHIDKDFDAVIFIGYHACGASNENPLAHTMNSSKIDYMKLNGEYLSEFLLHAYLASYLKVPVAFLSGDKGICKEVKKFNANIVTVTTNKGIGAATVSIHPNRAVKLIKSGVEQVLKGGLDRNQIKLPEKFVLEIGYKNHYDAYKNSFYPGVVQNSPKSIFFETDDYFEIMRVTSFVI